MRSFILKIHPLRTYILMGVVLYSTFSIKGSTTTPQILQQAYPSQEHFNLSIHNATLTNFVRQIEQATRYSFIYGEEVRLNKRITISAHNLTINEILKKALEHTSISFEISGKHILLHMQSPPKTTENHKFTISGYITDETSSETLIGANILEKNQHTGSATNTFGFYSLTLPEGNTKLSFSYLGYTSKQLSFPLRKDTLLNIALTTSNELKEVVIVSNKKEAGLQSTNMSAYEIPTTQIQNTPTILGEADVLKTIQLMPGVQAGVEGFSGLYVRGGSPDQNLILLDGIPIYNADHLLGVFSIFTPEAVKKVTLFKSSFPARYGGRLSSIVDVRTNNGDMKQFHGSFSLGSLTNKIHIEGPIMKNKTSFSLSARGTYTAFLANLIKTDGDAYNYYFYDLNAKVNHKFNDQNRLFFNFYKGKDHYHFNSDATTTYFDDTDEDNYIYADKDNINWGNTILAGRWNHVFNNKLFSNTTMAFNRYEMIMGVSTEEHHYYSNYNYDYLYNSKYTSGINDWNFRIDMDYTPSPVHHIKFGGEYLYHTFRPETTTSKIKEEKNDTAEQDTLYHNKSNSYLHGHETAAYVEDNFDLNDHISINAGIRFSFFYTQGKSYLSVQPRLSARYQFNHAFSAKASFTQMDQYVHLLSSTPFSMPTDLWVPITKKIRPMHANQYSIGGYYTGWSGWELSLEGYYKQMHNILEYKNGVTFFGSSTNWEDKVEMGDGHSTGLEFMIQKTIGRTTGWLAYTLAKSNRQFKNGSINNGNCFPDKYDRRHNISLCLNHKFGKRIDIGTSWIFYTGGTTTIPEQQTVYLTPEGDIIEANYIPRRNNYRLPSSHRLNLSINFNKKTKHGIRTWNISLYNVYNAMNPTLVYAKRRSETWHYSNNNGSYVKYQNEGKTIIKKLTLLPFIPSITYTYKF